MRKITLLFFSVLMVFICSSCKNEPAPIVTNFSAYFTAQCNGVEIKGKAVVNKNNMLSLTVSSPDAMKGYTYSYKKDTLTVKYGTMKISAQDNYLPKTAFPSIVNNIFRSLSKENNCYLDASTDLFATYKGNCDQGEFTIITQFSMGTISEIKIDGIDFYVKFRETEIVS